MLGTLKEYDFLVRVCTRSTDAHPHQYYRYKYKGSKMHCLPDTAHEPLLKGQMCKAKFSLIKEVYLVGTCTEGTKTLIPSIMRYNFFSEM